MSLSLTAMCYKVSSLHLCQRDIALEIVSICVLTFQDLLLCLSAGIEQPLSRMPLNP